MATGLTVAVLVCAGALFTGCDDQTDDTAAPPQAERFALAKENWPDGYELVRAGVSNVDAQLAAGEFDEVRPLVDNAYELLLRQHNAPHGDFDQLIWVFADATQATRAFVLLSTLCTPPQASIATEHVPLPAEIRVDAAKSTLWRETVGVGVERTQRTTGCVFVRQESVVVMLGVVASAAPGALDSAALVELLGDHAIRLTKAFETAN